MSWRGDLLTRLRADAGLAALCGTRIAWFEAGRSWVRTYPQVVLTEITPGREYTHEGPDELDRPRVQFDVMAADGAGAQAVESALLAEMEGTATAGATQFHEGFLEDRRTLEPVDLGDQVRVFGLQMDFTFHWQSV